MELPAARLPGGMPEYPPVGGKRRERYYCYTVGTHEKLYEHILLRRSDANVSFDALRALLKSLGFDERVKGDHHIFTREGVEEILNLQPKSGKGKPYQVKQVRNAILKYSLRLGD